MARIPLFPLDNMTDLQRRVYDAVVSGPRGMVVGHLRAALHRPELADKWQRLGEILRYRTSLPPRLAGYMIRAPMSLEKMAYDAATGSGPARYHLG
jgi:hypothetical protein